MNGLGNICQQLLWPAAAGNIAWSLLSLLMDPQIDLNGREPHIITLFLIGVYLCGNWLRRTSCSDTGKMFLVLDLAHISSVCIFALAIYYNSPLIEASVLPIFLIPSITHYSGIAPTTNHYWLPRLLFGSASALGLLVLLSFNLLPDHWQHWKIAASVCAVLAAWSLLLRFFGSLSSPR
jgi:hypothetical protein